MLSPSSAPLSDGFRLHAGFDVVAKPSGYPAHVIETAGDNCESERKQWDIGNNSLGCSQEMANGP